ncbi:related to permease of the major facilitator superfamily [Rhynchosporium secalis]|uniref:Related to permease of the major facilitator superfamily n=1 Tax=Rhynchosporium secalis TaxID=38038 RepID=A0A1E1MK64_RHYSE|nr:related to permease of the major facilitator superfamily [Rhynchosporium secalis]
MPPPNSKGPPVTWMSLPNKPQLFILALCRLSEPLSNTCLLPYLYYLIRSLQTGDTSQARISRQAGLLVSLFALSQFATSVPWASFANHYGRKPTIIIGLVLSIISNIGFGFSTTIPAVMCWRVLAGIGNGNIGVMRTMTAEIVVERKYQSRAFLLLPLVFNSGVVIGLALGGCLADPIVNIPTLFGPEGVFNFADDPKGVAWMRVYPFALPTICNGLALMCSLFLAVFGLKETMPGLEDRKDYGVIAGAAMRRGLRSIFKKESTGYSAVKEEDSDNDLMDMRSPLPKIEIPVEIASISPLRPKLLITSRAIWTREVAVTIVSFGLLPLHNSAFMQVFPVFLSTPPSEFPITSALKFNGGLGLPSPTIGLFLSAFGIFGILIQLCIYPSLQAWLGTLRSYRVALATFPFAYILAPYLCLIPSSHYILQFVGIAFILFLQVTARTFGIPSSVILLTNSAPSPLALGAVHGVGNMLSSLSRALGPALGGVIFGWGMERGVVGVVWWSYLLVISMGGLAWSWMLKEGERQAEKGSREECIELAKKEENEKEGPIEGSNRR